MSDFVAVLRKTLEGLGETSPEMRQRVYDKARSTIAAKLSGMNPPPPPQVAERQRRALEEAITEVERLYGPSTRAEPLDELENVLNSLNGLKNQPIVAPRPRQPELHRPAEPTPYVEPPRSYEAQRPVTTPTSRPPAPHQQPVRHAPPPIETAPEDDFEPVEDEGYDAPPPVEYPVAEETRKRGGFGRWLAALLLLVALAGGGYAAWLNKDQLSTTATELMNSFGQATATNEQPTSPTEPVTANAESEDQTDEASASNGPAKFTQQLNPDGSEIDAGPAASGATVGEGASVAEATNNATTPPVSQQQPVGQDQAAQEGTDQPEEDAQAPEQQPAAQEQPADTAQAPAATPPAENPTAPAQADTTAVQVGQRAIFYEERTNSADGSAEPGSIVWSVVQETPGGDLPPEPAIRAEATIPGKDVQLRMTIRRNADNTLPASHIIEMIFLTPQNFEGGGIDNVLRVALKSSEQDAGTPLAGIPAKISDGFFLIALNDSAQDKDANLKLLRERSWLDVPLVYKSGRRALITMEKGIPGEKVFDDVLKSWGQTSG